ncbi:unnamed protein product [Cercospora beticola]|nr:unnamed protein product [Cercospora beticola]
MADSKVEREFHTNYKATWKRRVLVGTAALAVLGIAAAAAAFAVRSRHETWWREGQAFPTYPDTEPFSGGRRIRWYGQVYYLPPGVRKGGLKPQVSPAQSLVERLSCPF